MRNKTYDTFKEAWTDTLLDWFGFAAEIMLAVGCIVIALIVLYLIAHHLWLIPVILVFFAALYLESTRRFMGSSTDPDEAD